MKLSSKSVVPNLSITTDQSTLDNFTTAREERGCMKIVYIVNIIINVNPLCTMQL